MNLGIPWQPLRQPGPTLGKPIDSAANLSQDISKADSRVTASPILTQNLNQGGGLESAQNYEQGADSERSRSPGRGTNPTKIIIPSRNDGQTAQPEYHSQGARSSALIADPTLAKASFPGIRARPTLKTALTQQSDSNLNEPGNSRLEGSIPQINQPKQTNHPKVVGNPNGNSQPGISIPNPVQGSEPSQASSIEQTGDTSQQQGSTQESGTGQAQNVEQASTSNQGQGETINDDISQPATPDGTFRVSGTTDTAENSEVTSISPTSNPQEPAGNQQNTNDPGAGQQIPQASDFQGVVVDGSTLTNNGAPITIAGKPVAFSSGVIRVGDEEGPVPTISQPQDPGFGSFTAAGLTFNPIPSLEPRVIRPMLEVQGQTLTDSGSAIRIDGQDVRLSSGVVHIASNTVSVPRSQIQALSPVTVGGLTFSPLPKTSPVSSAPPLVAAGQTARFENGEIQVGSQTLKPGASPIDVGGTRVSLGLSVLVIGSSTRPIPATTAETLVTTIATVGGIPIQAVDTGVMLVSMILTPGLATTISGTPISLGNNNNLLIGSNTFELSRPTRMMNPTIASIVDKPIQAVESGVRIGSVTLAPGAAATISGTPVSLGGSNNLVIGSSTIRFTPPIPAMTNMISITTIAS